MSIIEKQTTLGKSLFQINTQAVTELAELQRKNMEQFFSTNRDFGERMPEVRELSSFLSLQREYGGTLWSNAKEALTGQNAIFQNAFAEARGALKVAFTPAVAEAEVSEVRPEAEQVVEAG